jgi:hypothetical protein
MQQAEAHPVSLLAERREGKAHRTDDLRKGTSEKHTQRDASAEPYCRRKHGSVGLQRAQYQHTDPEKSNAADDSAYQAIIAGDGSAVPLAPQHGPFS